MIHLNPDTEPAAGRAAEATVSQLLVLVVEDSKIVRERLIRLLSVVPNLRIVAEATSAREAIAKIGEVAPDVVTLDLRLENGSGLDVLRALDGVQPRPRIAVLSNYGDQHSRRECLALGADYFFDKSLELTDLRALLTGLATSAEAGIRWQDREVTG
jgi:DNA-binding NarL/FixJ family response regulator